MKQRLRELNLGDRHRRAELHFNRGMFAPARDEYVALIERASGLTDESSAELRWRLGICLAALGQSEEAERVVDEALALPEVPERFRERLKALRGFSALSRGDYARAHEITRSAVERLHELKDPTGLTIALRWHALTCLRLGDLESAFESAYCSLAETRHAGLEAEAGHAHGILCVAFIQRAQYDTAIEHGKEALSVATRLGHQSAIVRNNLHLSIASRLAGDLDLAANYALRALASAEESDEPNLIVSARLAASRALRDSGRLDPARELAMGALEISRSGERERDHILVLEDLGDLDRLGGQIRTALEKYRVAWRKAETIAAEGDLVAELGWRIGASLLELGDAEGAGAWIEKSLVVCEKAGERKEHTLALRTRALWHARSGRQAEARSDLEESLTALESLNVPYEQAWTHLAFDTVLAADEGDSPTVHSERRRHLSCARRLFERIGAIHGLEMCRQAEAALAGSDTIDGPPGGDRDRGRRGTPALDIEWPSRAFRAALEDCRKLGPTSLPILLVGETGTGKTLLAEALDQLGHGGREGGFFPVNCAALPHHLQESELFGHRKGAFTGAEREHPGIFREAGRGTVFLDEIDKTSLEFQAKLLHVLDYREIRPVGSTQRVPVEARIVGATNRDLFALVEKGKFLEDLHHRLTCGIIQVPALRDRVEDLRMLSLSLLEEICAIERTPVPEITEDGWRLLTTHDWPGNVRELKSLLHRAVALNRGSSTLSAEIILDSAPLGSTLRGQDGREALRVTAGAGASSLAQRMENAEREEILRAFEKAGGVRKKAAEILGISYRGLGKKMARLGIEISRRRAR
jgi:DNA-binding NtrC family response regulator